MDALVYIFAGVAFLPALALAEAATGLVAVRALQLIGRACR
jgi:hypothetical protein